MMKSGEVTAYLSLIFILLVSFVGAILESASVQNAKNYRRADMNRGMECIFAEYQKELQEKYEIFALDGSYETGSYDESKLFDRLAYYGADDIKQEIIRIQFLTDNDCKAFYEQVTACMEHKYGLDRVKEYIGKADIWRQQEEGIKDFGRLETEKQKELSSLLEQHNAELPKENNPIAHIDILKGTPLLTLVMPKDMQLSEKRISLSDMVSHRKLNRGYGDFSDIQEEPKVTSLLFFGEYVMEHFSTVQNEEKTGAVDYEVEYILEGKESDKENLEAVVKKLLMLRFVPNYAFLQTDSAKKAEAEALAAALCTLFAVPEIIEAAAQMILLAWAYGEAIVDIRSLLKGNKVPLLKSKESWQLQLSSLLTLGTEEDKDDGMDTEGGLLYKEYLRMLLFLKEQEQIGARTLDVIEQNLRMQYGQKFFHADQCISKLELLSKCSLRRGVSYRFSTYFAYH